MTLFIIASIAFLVFSIFDFASSTHPLFRESIPFYRKKDGTFSKGKYLLINAAGYGLIFVIAKFVDKSWTASTIALFGLAGLRLFFAILNRKRLNKALGK